MAGTSLFLEVHSLARELLPEIVILRNHATPYPDPTTGQEAPFMTVGSFSSMDPLFPGVAGRLATVYCSGGDAS